MITRVEIPKLTLTMEEVTLLKWIKQEGEPVEKDELLFEVETDKTVVEVPSPIQGLVKKILVREGTVAGGMTVAFIGEASDHIPDIAEDKASKSLDETVSARTTLPPRSEEQSSARTTPAARRRARELGVRLESLAGTGPEGRVTQEDVERMASTPAVRQPSPVEDHRRLIGERTSNAWRTGSLWRT